MAKLKLHKEKENKKKNQKKNAASVEEAVVKTPVLEASEDVAVTDAPAAAEITEEVVPEAEAPTEEEPSAAANVAIMLSEEDMADGAKKQSVGDLFLGVTAKFKTTRAEKKKAKEDAEQNIRTKPRQNLMLSIKNLTIGKENITTTVIAIDPARSAFHFYSMLGSDRETLTHHVRNYAGTLFDENFFKRFKYALKEYATAHPVEGIRKVTLIVPDNAVSVDIFKMPTMRGLGKTGRNLPYAISALHKKPKELRVVSYMVHRDRRYTAYSVSAIQRSVMTALYAACSENGMLVEAMTFASASRVAAVSNLHPKQKNASYLLLDFKERSATYTFVVRGKAMGFYSIPFGLEFLRGEKVVSEDLLFNHSHAELAVLNAREKAKAKKQLTVMASDDDDEYEDDGLLEDAEDVVDQTVEEGASAMANTTENGASVSAPVEEEELDEELDELMLEEEFGEEGHLTEEGQNPEEGPETIRLTNPKVFTRKSARRLPKFMQRPVAETKSDILAENFRIFVKWALTLIASNEKIVELGEPAYVLVNLPADLAPVIEYANRELAENGIRFKGMLYTEEDAKIAANLPLFGGFTTKQSVASKF